MKTKISPLTKDMLAEAGILLSQRHQRHRRQFPSLPPRFEDVNTATTAATKLFEKKSALGYAAFRNDKMIAFLFGDQSSEPWGRCGWVRLPASALAPEESPMVLQDLYVKLGEDWVRRGVFTHHTYLSVAEPRLVDAWFDLDFGKERIDAMLDIKELAIPPIKIPRGIKIRRAGKGDNSRLSGMSHIIFRELEKAPYWHPTPPEVWDALEEGWGELADDNTVDTWLALDGDETVSTIASWSTMHPDEDSETDMHADNNVVTFSVAATQPTARKRGIATAMTWMCLAHNREKGFEYCYTNWISPNLSASRFWPRFGFQEVAYRLTRNLNPMISWTREA